MVRVERAKLMTPPCLMVKGYREEASKAEARYMRRTNKISLDREISYIEIEK